MSITIYNLDKFISNRLNNLNALIHLNLLYAKVLVHIYHSHIHSKHHNQFLIWIIFFLYQIQLFIDYLNNHYSTWLEWNKHEFNNKHHSSYFLSFLLSYRHKSNSILLFSLHHLCNQILFIAMRDFDLFPSFLWNLHQDCYIL